MPKLPEVETTRRGLEPYVVGRSIARVLIREPRLRWPLDSSLRRSLEGSRIDALRRRGKYLLFDTASGSLLIHLGMSGGLRYHSAAVPPRLHDHVDIEFADGGCLRYHDPRRFGSMHFAAVAELHPLLTSIGPEPLGPDFTPAYLWQACQGRKVAIKQQLMNSKVVAGVGNIYANEALFRAGINPALAAGRISKQRVAALVAAVREVLAEAITQDGTTLKDFADGEGKPGYFQLALDVYGRAGLPCHRCAQPVRLKVQGQRATYHCRNCQR